MNAENNKPSERLRWILNELNISAYSFSKRLSYKSPDTVYNILNGKNEICDNFLLRIKHSVRQINLEWIKYGTGKPLYHFMEIGNANEIHTKEKIIYPGTLNFEFIKKIAKCLELMLLLDSELCKVEVRIIGIVGLEYKFTTFFYENGKAKMNKYYSIIISPDWMVSSFFDFWSINESSMRCQNLLKLMPNLNEEFMNAIYPIYQEILHFVDSQPEAMIPSEFQFLKSSDDFIEL